jgi:CRP-like cAMP-binding protein
MSAPPNHFLTSLTPQDSELIKPHLRPMELGHGAVLFRAQETIDHVYFPFGGVVSLVVGLSSGQFVEAGMFGLNTAIGAAATLDGSIALNQAIGQVAGAGVAGESGVLKKLAAQSETLRDAFVRHEQVVTAQIQQVAACNALHELEERLSRWLQQTRDLLQSDTLPLTQDFVAQMLGVQRSSVTIVAGKLQEAGSSLTAVDASMSSIWKRSKIPAASAMPRSTIISTGLSAGSLISRTAAGKSTAPDFLIFF